MVRRPLRRTSLLLAFGLLALNSCQGREAPRGEWDARTTGGPVVTFDLFARPLPEIPLPNDVATRPDPSSPTGRRLNASLVASTALERGVRDRLSKVDGFGLFAPITVSFEPVDRRLDLGNILRRHRGDGYDFTDDAIYVINIDPDSPAFGQPVPLDLGNDLYPVHVPERDVYYANDSRGHSNNLVVETTYEDTNGNGLLDICEDVDHDGVADPGEDLDGDGVVFSAERDENGNGLLDPEEDTNGNGRLDCSEDTDSDGHLDEPNLYCGEDVPPWECPSQTYDSPGGEVELPPDDLWLVNWYERETNTLSIHPVVPFEEGTQYAVVLTDRLVDGENRPVSSPFPAINHSEQSGDLGALPEILGADAAPFGGLTINDVQFTWTFTTQTITPQIQAIREGFYGRGQFAYLSDEFSDGLHLDLAYGCEEGESTCDIPGTPYVVQARSDDDRSGLIDVLSLVAGPAFNLSPEMLEALVDTYEYVDYFAHGRFVSPNYIDNDDRSEDLDGDGHLDLVDEDVNENGELDPGEDLDFDGHLDVIEDSNNNMLLDGEEGFFFIDLSAGSPRHGRLTIPIMVTLPEADPERGIEPPFPVVIYHHGSFNNRIEAMGFAGSLAKYGLATIAIDTAHHGFAFGQVVDVLLEDLLAAEHLRPLAHALKNDRARDLNGDGVEESGSDIWTAYLFHNRDMLRQTTIDVMRLVQILRTFDGQRRGEIDTNGDGEVSLAGDFNGDGTVDVGGPDADYFVMGTSLGGILAGFVAGVEPAIVAAAPISPGGGLSDLAMRSTQSGVMGAVVLRTFGPLVMTIPASLVQGTRCDEDQVSAHFFVPDLKTPTVVEFACLDEGAIEEGDTLVLTNVANEEVDCAVVWPDGASRVVVPSDLLDPLTLTIYEGDVLIDGERCDVRHDAVEKTVIGRFEVEATFQTMQWSAGDELVAPAEGFGMERATPSLRRFTGIGQIGVDGADPANVARYFTQPLDYGEETSATNVMTVLTIGDPWCPVSTGLSIARSAGVIDLFRPDPRLATPDGEVGVPADRFMSTQGVIKGMHRLTTYRRSSDGERVLFDPDDMDRSGSPPTAGWTGDGYEAPSPSVPLRLWRPTIDGETCTCVDDEGEHPCQWPGDTFGPVRSVMCPGGVQGLALPLVSVYGVHALTPPDPTLDFDIFTFMINMIGHYFATGGTELRWDLCMEDSSCTVEEHGFLTPPVGS